MKIKLLLYLFLVLDVSSSCKNNSKKVTLDKRNFSIVTMNDLFPITNIASSSYETDSLGLTCKKCMTKDYKKIYYSTIIINRTKNIFSYQIQNWGVSYSFYYDKSGRVNKEVVSSCFNWNIT